MFVHCSETGISVIVKHVRHTGIIRVFCLFRGVACYVFQYLGRQKKTARLRFAWGISTQADAMVQPRNCCTTEINTISNFLSILQKQLPNLAQKVPI